MKRTLPGDLVVLNNVNNNLSIALVVATNVIWYGNLDVKMTILIEGSHPRLRAVWLLSLHLHEILARPNVS